MPVVYRNYLTRFLPHSWTQLKAPPLAIPFCCFFFRKWIKNAGKNHALINRNYVRSRGRALPPSACLPGRTPAASRGILAATWAGESQ